MAFRSLPSISALAVMSGILGGCEAIQVATFSGHPNSNLPNKEIQLELISLQNAPNTDVQTQRDYDSFCLTKPKAEFLPFLIPIITGVATFIVDQGSQALQGWIQKRINSFTTSFPVVTTDDAFLVKSGNQLRPAIDCIVLKQYVKPSPDTDDKAAPVEGFVFAAQITPTPNNQAFKLVPTFYRLSKSTALTDSKSGKVDIDLKFVFDIIGSGDNPAQKSTGLGTAEIALKSVVLPAPGQAPVPVSILNIDASHSPVDPRVGNKNSSGLLPIVASDTAAAKCISDKECNQLEPLTLGVTLSETGTGSEAFGKLKQAISDNTKTLESSVSSSLQSLLSPSNATPPPH